MNTINITSHVLLYIFMFFVILYLIITAYIRKKLDFWLTQPVFHIYNLKYWVNPPGTINKEYPNVNKYVNLINNKLIQIDYTNNDDKDKCENKIEIKKICSFIKNNYIKKHPLVQYNPTYDDIISYLQHSSHNSFFNVYQEPKLLFENGIPSNLHENEIIGVASCKSLNVTIKNNNEKPTFFQAYYVDNLCVKPSHRRKGIAPEIIQTFYYNMSRKNNKINTYIFKREDKINTIVPLVYYDTYSYDISCVNSEYIPNNVLKLIEITNQNTNILIIFIKDQINKFDCSIIPDVSNLIHLINKGKLKIYGLLFNNELISIYIFRILELYNNKNKTSECISIISNCNDDVLVTGFMMSLQRIIKLKTSILLIEDTADSNKIIKYISKNKYFKLMFKSPTAFFLYNYACYSFKNDKTLLIY
jgi:hypothetical protein